MGSMIRGGQVASRQAHILENAGSNPALVTIMVLMLVLCGCGVSLQMHAVDKIGERLGRIATVAEWLEEETADPEIEATPTPRLLPSEEPEVEHDMETVDREKVSHAAKVILYELQEIYGWFKPLKKDVGEVPPKRKLKLDTTEERDTRFEYTVKAGAKASERARKKGRWNNWVGKVIKWTVSAVWNLLPWWLRYPLLAILTVWLGAPVYINYQRARAARAAAQGEAAVARMQKYVNDEQFAEAVDAEHNPDLARVHEKQRSVEANAARKKAVRKA